MKKFLTKKFRRNSTKTEEDKENKHRDSGMESESTLTHSNSLKTRKLSSVIVSTCGSIRSNRTSFSGPQTCNTWNETDCGKGIKHVNSLMILHRSSKITKLIRSRTNSFENNRSVKTCGMFRFKRRNTILQ